MTDILYLIICKLVIHRYFRVTIHTIDEYEYAAHAGATEEVAKVAK